MNMTLTPLRKEKGSTLLLITVTLLLVLMGMAGLTIDLSHAFL